MRLPLPQYIRFAMTLSVSYPVSLLLFRSFSLLLTKYQHPKKAFTDLNDLSFNVNNRWCLLHEGVCWDKHETGSILNEKNPFKIQIQYSNSIFHSQLIIQTHRTRNHKWDLLFISPIQHWNWMESKCRLGLPRFPASQMFLLRKTPEISHESNFSIKLFKILIQT